MSGQKPMAERMQETTELLWKHGQIQACRIDKKVLKRLIAQGKVKRKLIQVGFGYKTNSMVIAIEPAPTKEVTETAGPYAKRKAALEELGLNYRGKNWGKVRVDLPREAREKKISEKKLMWKKLKDWRT